MGEALHGLRPGHAEAHCAVCQLAHHAPAAGQGLVSLSVSSAYSLVALAPFLPSAAAPLPLARGRSPPVS